MESPKKNRIHFEFSRFLLVGATNTAISYVIYLLLLEFMAYLYAYSIAYGLRKFLQFPAVYALQYGVGAAILWLLVGQASLSPELAMLAVVAVTIPVTFLTSRFILKR
jgi:putative flippase GtrA